MSGGSFDCLYMKEADDWVGQQCTKEAEEMITAFIEEGAEDAAKELRVILAIADNARVRIEALVGKNRELWRAMEWWKSNDRSKKTFTKALAKWRGEPEMTQVERHEYWHPEDYKAPIWEYIEKTFAPANRETQTHLMLKLLNARDNVTKPVLICVVEKGLGLDEKISYWVGRYIALTEAIDRLTGEMAT